MDALPRAATAPLGARRVADFGLAALRGFPGALGLGAALTRELHGDGDGDGMAMVVQALVQPMVWIVID